MAEKKATFSSRLREGLDMRRMTQAELATKSGVSKSSISRYLKGDWEGKQDAVYSLALALNVAEAWLMGYDVPAEPKKDPLPPGCIPMPETEQVPLVGRIACGTPILVEQNIEAYVPVLSRWHADFALTCEGQSMEPLFQDGDLVAIRKQPSVEQGQVAAVRIGSEVTLKRVYLHQDCIELRPENSAFDSIIKFREEMNEVVIEGRAVGLCRGLA